MLARIAARRKTLTRRRLVNAVRHLDPLRDERLGLLDALDDERARHAALAEETARLRARGWRELPLGRDVPVEPVAPGPVTRRLAAELGDWQPDLDRLDDATRHTWEQADDDQRVFLRVRLAVWLDAPGYCARTGLSRADPPEHVHAMARGPLAAGGALDAADLVASAIADAGGDPAQIGRALDFGSSSGRVVRVLAATHPRTAWHGCDPNAPAIAWARDHLPGIDFRVSPQRPPLPYDDGCFDLVYAISVWSHFAEAPALAWLAEMGRVVRPGGLLVLTAQGWQTVHHFATGGLWAPDDARAAAADLYRHGHHFRRIFGAGGDHGVEDDGWGAAMFSPEWLARHVTPDWSIAFYRPGAHERNQDVYVLRRR